MKILFVSTALHKEFGGPPEAVVGAAQGCSLQGNQVTVLIFGQNQKSFLENQPFYESLRSSNVDFYLARTRKTSRYGSLGNYQDLKLIWKQVGYSDIVSMHSVYNFQNLLIATICLIRRRKFTLMPHGTLTNYQRKKHRFRKTFINPLFSWVVLKPAGGIFVATPVEKKQIPKYLDYKTKVVGLGLNLPTLVEPNKDSNSSAFTFLYMGRITSKKRLDLALLAFAKVRLSTDRSINFIICGDGEQSYVKSVKDLSSKLALDDLVEFKGWINGREKIQVLLNSDSFLLTSEDENFAIAVAESLSYGLPCVISKEVALSESVIRFNAGVVFSELDVDEISQSMLQIMNMDEKTLRANALQASREFDWNKVSSDWILEFKHILEHD